MRGVFTPAALAPALAALCLLGLAALGFAGAAQAQVIPVKLVGNIGQAAPGVLSFDKDLATAFTTGSHSDGYRLTQVGMQLRHEAGFGLPIYEVGIHADSSGSPGTRVGTLSTPPSLPVTFGTVVFVAGGDINLAANTTYWLVIDVQLGGDRTQVRSTRSPLEDDAGGRPGWSIADNGRWRLFNSGGVWFFGSTLKIQVWGSLEDTTAPTLVAGTINAKAVKLYFSEPLDSFGTLNSNQFTVTGNPTDLGAVATVDFDGTEKNVISLTTTNAATNSDTVTVTIPTTTGITDVAGNALAAITTAFSLTNTRSGAPGKPTLNSASVDGSALTLTYNQKLLPSFPPLEAFTVSATSTSTAASDLAINPGTTSSTVVLSLHPAVKADDTVTLSYNTLYTPPLQNHWSEKVDALSNHRVANDTDPPVARIEGDGIIDEGEDAEFTVILKPAPAGQVTVSLTITETGGFVESGDVGTKTVAVTNTGAATYSVPTKVLDRAMPMNGTVTATLEDGTGYTVHDTENADTVTVTDLAATAEVTAVAISSMPSHDRDDDGTPETYRPNEKIQVSVTFDKAVTVTGTPQLKIKMDPSYGEFPASYESGSGTTNLVFAYRVVSPNVSTRGVAVLENTLALNGGTIRSGGTQADLRHSGLPHNAGHKVDTSPPPTFQRASVNGATLALVFNKTLDGSSVPDPGDFHVTVAGSRRDVASGGVAISGTTVTLRLASAVAVGDTVWVRYDRPDTNPLQDTIGIDVATFGDQSVTNTTSPPVTRPPTRPPGGGGGGGGGGSDGSDRHGNSAATATPFAFPSATPRWGDTTGRINTRSDVDYFRLRLAQAGVLLLETNGSTDTRGTVWQAGAELAAATDGGPGANFRLTTPVEADDVVIAIAGEGGATGAYTLRARLVVSHLENPAPTSFQSGLGLISGWVCEAEGVTVEIEKADGTVVELAAAYGTERADTEDVCSDSDNGFGVLVNWNLLDDGTHAVRVLVNGVSLGTQVVDGIEIGRAPVTVTTLGAEFVKGLQGSLLVADFPRAGEQVHLVWQESQQNFVLAPAEGGATVAPAPSSGGIEGVLENPRPASFQSGIGVISGWVCEAEAVVIEIDGQSIAAAAGTERADTLDVCGDVDNGFGLLVNWAEFGAGAHEVVALVDGAELSRATVTVTVVDEAEPFVRGLAKRVELAGFPTLEETVTLEWQESQQNFVITGVD